MAQELTFNISEDRRNLQGPVEAKNFNLKFGTDGVAITHGNPKQWVQGRIGDNELKQVFVNITEGENNTPKDVAGLFLAFVGIIHDKDGRPHRVVDYKHSTTIDVEHGRFRFDFPDQAFTVAGEYQQAFFMLVKEGPGGGCVATMEFDMQVMANFVFTDLVPEDYITPFNDTVDQLLAACKKFKDDTAADEAKFKQELEDAYAKFQKDTNTQLNNFKDATNEDLANFKKANADDIAKFKQQYADAVQAKEDELQSKVDSYTDKLDTMLKDLNQQGIDTTTMLTNLRSQMAALQDKINSEHLFTEDEAKQLENRLALKLSTGYMHTYGTVDEMLSDQDLKAGMYVRTAGYYTVNDGGAAEYLISSKKPVDYSEQLTNGLYAQLIHGSGPVNVLTYGVRNDDSEDCSTVINTLASTHSLYFPAGKYKVSNQLNIYHELKGDGGSSYYANNTEGITTFHSAIKGNNDTSVICNHGNSNVFNGFDIILNDNETGLTDNGTGSTSIQNLFVGNVKNAYGVKIDRPGSRASNIDHLYIEGADGTFENSGLYYLTGTDESLSNVWIMGCRCGIRAVSCLFYGTNVHIWCSNAKVERNWFSGTTGMYLQSSRAYISNIYLDTARMLINTDGKSYASIKNMVGAYDQSIAQFSSIKNGFIIPQNNTDSIQIDGGYVFESPIAPNLMLIDSSQSKINHVVIQAQWEDNPEDYLTDKYRYYFPNANAGYTDPYHLSYIHSASSWCEVARMPLAKAGEAGGISSIKISDGTGNSAELSIRASDGQYMQNNLAGDLKLAYKIINRWIVIYAQAKGDWYNVNVTPDLIGDLSFTNYSYCQAMNSALPRLVQKDSTGLTPTKADGNWNSPDQ